MNPLFILTVLTIFLDICNGNSKAAERLEKLKEEYPGNLTCYECKNPVECAKEAENLQRKESPRLILKDDNPDTAMGATCHIKVDLWSDCSNGPNKEGFVIRERELKITKLQDLALYQISSNSCNFRSKFCDCEKDLCNLEISDIASCDERKKMRDWPCPREGTTIPSWTGLRDAKEMEQNEKCSNTVIECYKSGYQTRGLKITDDFQTKQAFLGEGPFTACTADFIKNKKSPLFRVVGRSLSDSNSEKVNRCNCKNEDCTRLTCNCYADKCNNWETLPCTPGKFTDPQNTDSRCEI